MSLIPPDVYINGAGIGCNGVVNETQRDLTAVSRGRLLCRTGQLKTVLDAAGISYRGFAQSLGRSPTTVRAWGNGERVPRAQDAERVAEMSDRLLAEIDLALPDPPEPA
jgi:hypothetical protein